MRPAPRQLRSTTSAETRNRPISVKKRQGVEASPHRPVNCIQRSAGTIGIDLGTTNSCVSRDGRAAVSKVIIENLEGARTTLSRAVAAADDGANRVVLAAVRPSPTPRTPPSTRVKRLDRHAVLEGEGSAEGHRPDVFTITISDNGDALG